MEVEVSAFLVVLEAVAVEVVELLEVEVVPEVAGEVVAMGGPTTDQTVLRPGLCRRSTRV